MRLKLAGGDRSKGSGVLCADAHDLSFNYKALCERVARLGLAYSLVRALRDLIRHPEVRTLPNIAIALSGVIFLVVGAMSWFSSAFQHNAAL
jgi:hypothetical protein